MALNPTERAAEPRTPRLAWSFNHDASSASRQLRAAEFAAMYLDGIEIQLVRIADALAAQTAAHAKLLATLDRLAGALEDKR
jgi:hypothetical protein